MKRRLFYFCLMAVLLMAGCSGKEETSTVLAAEEANEVPAYYKNYVANPQVTADAVLQEKGQSIRDDKGELEVHAVEMDNQSHKVGPVEITIREAKNLHYKPAHSLVDFYHSYTHHTEFNLAKFFVEIQNTSDEPVQFAPIALLKTSEGETKLWEDDVYLEELNGELAAGETKKGNLGFIIEKPELDALVITTSDVFAENDEKLAKAEEIKIKLK